LARISRSSIMEYHAFGIISYALQFGSEIWPVLLMTSLVSREGVKANAHYLICGVQGDFTRSLVEKPPTHLWTRQLKVCSIVNSWRY